MTEGPLPASASVSVAPPTLSHDVREVLYMAEYAAARRYSLLSGQPSKHITVCITAADIWWGLAMTARPFSVPSRFIKGLGLTSKRIKQAVKAVVQPKKPATLLPVTHPLFSVGRPAEDWVSLAAGVQQASLAGQSGAANTGAVDLPALLAAVIQHPDTSSAQVPVPATATPEKVFEIDAHSRQHQWGIPRRGWAALAFYLRETLEIVVVMLLFLVVIKDGLGELRLIPSESMVPTLQVGDRLLIEKVTRWFRPLHRGDIIVFYPPEPEAVLYNDPWSWLMRTTGFSSLFHNAVDDPVDKAYIKRLIGMPGDTLWMVNNEGVIVNSTLLPEPYVNEIAYGCGNACRPITIPDGYYLMLGDNRNQSKDGRYFGLVPKERILGRAVYRVWPISRIGLLEPIPHYPEHVR